MNILFASESLWMEGVVYDIHILAEGLSLLGHTVYAFDPGRFTDAPAEARSVSRVFPDAKVELHSLNVPQRMFVGKPAKGRLLLDQLYKAYYRYRQIDAFLASHQIDVIVLYSAVRIGMQVTVLRKKYGIPIVFRNVDKLYNLWPARAKAARFVAKTFEKFIYRRMNMLFALTPKYGDYLVDFGADPKKLHLLPFPLDTQEFRPGIDCTEVRQRWGLKDGDQPIVFIGTLYEFGGVLELARQFPRVLERAPRAKLLIVGDGPIRPAIERFVAEAGLEKSIILTGYQPFSDMPKYVSAAALCVNSFPLNKQTNDIFSAKIVQYLACGKATVSSGLPGITTLLTPDKSGVVYSDTIEGIPDRIVELLNDEDQRKALEQKGRRYTVEAHSHRIIILRLEEKLKDLLAHLTEARGSY